MDFSRQRDLLNPDHFNIPINIIGAGATGSHLAYYLAKMGLEDITVYDFDVINEHNIPNQLFGINDIDKYKVHALYSIIKKQTGIKIKFSTDKVTNQRMTGIVFIMVDSMAARKEIWENCCKLKSAVKLVIEPRMGLSMGRIYSVNNMSPSNISQYEENFYSDDEADVSLCGISQTIITTGTNIASLCARLMLNWFNNKEIQHNEIIVDYDNFYFVTTCWE